MLLSRFQPLFNSASATATTAVSRTSSHHYHYYHYQFYYCSSAASTTSTATATATTTTNFSSSTYSYAAAVAAIGAAIGLLSTNVVVADYPFSSQHPSTNRPSRTAYKYVICGGGVAAQEALSVFAEHKQSSQVLVVTPEWRSSLTLSNPTSTTEITSSNQNNTYNNNNNSNNNNNNNNNTSSSMLSDMFTSMSSWWSSSSFSLSNNNAEILLGCRVKSIDSKTRIATLDNDEHVQFDKILIAVGSRVPNPPIGRVISNDAARAGLVGTATSHADWHAISQLINTKGSPFFSSISSSSSTPPHFTVVGANWMSAIVGARLVRMGAAVTFAYTDPCFLARCLPKYVAKDLRTRMEFIARQTSHGGINTAGIDLLAYSAVRFITARPSSSSSSSSSLNQKQQQSNSNNSNNNIDVGSIEAEVHAGSVFDAFSIVDFRTDCVLFVPTGGAVEHLEVTGVKTADDGVFTTNAQLSAASDIYVAGAATGQWGEVHAKRTGRHAAKNMLGAREAFDNSKPNRLFIDLSDLNVDVTVIGDVDGSLESFGYFASTRQHDINSNNDDENTEHPCCGGKLVRGVIFCVSGAPPRFRGDGLRLVIQGIALWNGVKSNDQRQFQDLEKASQKAEDLVLNEPMTRAQLERVMDDYVREFAQITDFEEVVNTSFSSSTSSLKPISEDNDNINNEQEQEDEQLSRSLSSIYKRPVPGVIWRRHLSGRRVPLREDELLWVENEWVGAASPINKGDEKSQAYADLLRRSAGNPPGFP